MITEQYSHILEENRVTNAQLVEEAFYQKHAVPKVPSQDIAEEQNEASNKNRSLVEKVLNNPEVLEILRALLESTEE